VARIVAGARAARIVSEDISLGGEVRMAHQTSYEVHVKQAGRWEIHARYSATEKEKAIEEAKALDAQAHIEAVKVIQEIYDPAEGVSKEYNVYAPGQKKHIPKRTGGKGANKEQHEEAELDVTKLKIRKQADQRSMADILIRIAVISGASSIVGAMFTWFTSMALTETDISHNAQLNILFIVFLATFVISAIPMAIVFLNSSDD